MPRSGGAPPTLRLRYAAKSGVRRDVAVDDARLARLVRRCRELPGQHLFEYMTESGRSQAVGSSDVNAYLEAAAGAAVTSKDFRTWGGSLVALRALLEAPPPRRAKDLDGQIRRAVDAAAAALGNSAAVCRRSYVHPEILARYRADPEAFRRAAGSAEGRRIGGLRAAETFLLELVSDA